MNKKINHELEMILVKIMLYIALAISLITFIYIKCEGYIYQAEIAKTLPISIIFGSALIGISIITKRNKKE